MKIGVRACLLLLGLAPMVFAQMPPSRLPPPLVEPKQEPKTDPQLPIIRTKPKPPEEERAEAIKNLKEDISRFDTDTLEVKKVEGHWVILANKGVLKDYGQDRATADEVSKLLRDLRINEIGTVPGARPNLEYWLVDGKAPRPVLDRRTIMPITASSLRAENISGAWVLTDGARAFYDFGTGEAAAKQAALVFWKYGFNQLGLLGHPTPTVLYPLRDPLQQGRDQKLPTFVSSPLQIAADITKTSLLLPGNVYGGPRSVLDLKTVEIVKREQEYFLVHGRDTWGRFGTTEHQGRTLLKLLQDAKVDEVIQLGEIGFPVFFAQGQPLRAKPLGVTSTTVRVERVKVQKLRETWWLFDESRPLLEVGTKRDAEILLLTMQQFGLDTLSVFGRSDGGMRLLSKSR